jgi:hypothetical protein
MTTHSACASRQTAPAVRNKWLKCSRRLQRAHGQGTVSFPTAGGESGVQGHVRHQWAMSHCREKAEHLLLNTQHAHSDSSEALAAQFRAHCERRAAYARRCCSKAPHKTPPWHLCRRPRARRDAGAGMGACFSAHTPLLSTWFSDVQRAPPEGAYMYVAISIWAQTPAGAIQIASYTQALLKTARCPPESETFQTPAEIDSQNRPATGNGCSETVVLKKLLGVSYAHIWQSQSSYHKLEVRPKVP